MAMAIERTNSFHLMLSDDELTLLRLLAEREGLNPSDYLRTTLRRLAGTPPQVAQALRVAELLGGKIDYAQFAATGTSAAKKKGR
jgi:hypothetical protein